MSEIYWESLNDGSHPLDVQIVCMKAVGSYYISYTLRDKGSILTIRKEELTGKYQPLENNCGVYLLIGDDKETGKKNVYVGQALTRETTNGMDRLREHASNQNERYFFKWTYAIVITTENNSFDSATVDTIEKMLITLFQQQSNINCLNGKVGTSGNISRARFENAYTAIKSLLQLKMFDLNLDKITDEVRLTEETIAEVLNQYREQIRAEIDDNRLTAEEKEILEYHRKAKVYDEFRSHIENAGNYVVNGRVYSMSEITNMVKSSEVTTPDNIAKDMIELLPKDVFNSKTKFLDIYCKSGVYICELIDKLMSSDYTLPINHEEEFKDLRVRLNHIVTNQLYAITGSLELNAVSCNAILNKIDEWNNKLNNGVNYALKKDLTLPNVLCIHNFKGNVKAYGAKLSDYVLDKFGMNLEESGEGYMKFDVVIGNPPYNNDIYIDFVNIGHELSKEYCCMITPAKWQAKGGVKNEQFRKNIVPYMSKIVYYPDCTDVFAIGDPGGISYYIIDNKNIYKEKEITNIAVKQLIYNDTETRNFDNYSLYNKGTHIANKVMVSNKSIDIEMLNKDKKYQVWSANKVSLVSNIPKTCLWSTEGMFNCLGLQQVAEKDTKKVVYETNGLHKSEGVPVDSRLIFSSNSLEECKSFISYCYTRLVRYLLSLSLCGLTGIATGNEWWRFVPDPGKFDHIFTDQELYEKYNLTEEEIAIIESVIKERK